MTDMLLSYCTAALQVTVICACTVLLKRALGARRPTVVAVLLTVASVCTVGLTVAAFVPLPDVWSLSGVTRSSLDKQPIQASLKTTERNSIPANKFDNSHWMTSFQILTGSATAVVVPRTRGWSWPWACTAAIGATILLLLARLLGGVWSANQLVRRAWPAGDTRLLREVDRLREQMNCRRNVKIVVSPAVASAATIGWHRPVLIISDRWREWTHVELVSVLAHELTHVRRGDYLTGIVARTAVSLHFYNPAIRWLAHSICFSQEAVADMNAAQAVGSREQYLTALSKLALRQDDNLKSLPALAFAFTSSKFLMRRIRMLQTKDGPRRSTFTLHAAIAGTLVLLAVATSTFRRPAQSQEVQRPYDVSPVKRMQAPFDLSYVVPSKDGIVAVRPYMLFARPDMQIVTAMIDTAINNKVAQLDADLDFSLSVADLEQAVGLIDLETNDPNGKHGKNGRLSIGLSAVRSKEGIPLVDLMRAVHPDTSVTKVGTGTVIETPDMAIPAFGPERHFAMPDGQTVVPGLKPDDLRELQRSGARDVISSKSWYGTWQQVQQHMVALLLDNSSIEWEHLEELEDMAATRFTTLAKNLALGLNLEGERLEVLLIVEPKDAAQSQPLKESITGTLAYLVEESEKGTDTGPLGKVHLAALRRLMTADPKVVDGRVTMTAFVDLDLPTLVAQVTNLPAEASQASAATTRTR